MQSPVTLYLLPGMVADQRYFQEFRRLLQPYPTRCLDWVTPHPKQGLPEYARRIARQVDPASNPLFFGVSLGGMVAIELQALFPGNPAILVSSAKHKGEIPSHGRFLGNLGAHRLLPVGLIKKRLLRKPPFDASIGEEKIHNFIHMLEGRPERFIRWAAGAATRWKREAPSGEVWHFHGTSDQLIPEKNISGHFRIEGGSHFMMTDRTEVLAAEIHRLLAKNQFSPMAQVPHVKRGE